MVKPSVIEKRKRLAKKLIQDTLIKGQKIGGREGLKNLLNREAEDLELDDGFFNVLSEKDLLELLADAVDFASERNAAKSAAKPSNSAPRDLERIPEPSMSSRSIPPNPPTPPRSDTDDEKGPDEIPGESKVEVECPTYEDEELQFNVRAYHPRQGDYMPLRASWCQEKSSFMSMAIVKRCNLYSYMHNGGKIKLIWEKQAAGEETPKTISTIFQVIDDEKIKHDIAIGTAWRNEEDNNAEEEEVEDEDTHVHDDQSEDDADSVSSTPGEDGMVGLRPRHIYPPGLAVPVYPQGLSDSRARTITKLIMNVSREQEREEREEMTEMTQFYNSAQIPQYQNPSKRRTRSFETQNSTKQGGRRKPKSKP